MQHRRYWSLTLFAALVLLFSARACSFDSGTALFVLPDNPDDLKFFLDGKLAILQPGFHTRHLVAAYRYLSGMPLTVDERKQFVAVNDYYLNPGDMQGRFSDKPNTAVAAWVSARAAIGPIDGYLPDNKLDIDRTPRGQNDYYYTFPNCLNPAFTSAAATLTNLTQQYTAGNPAVAAWVRGQDAVFSNCGDGKPPEYFGPGKPPTPPPAPHLPAALPAGAPLWLQRERAYQLAAANFYAMDFDAALAGFRAIAADTASPRSTLARYLVARTLIRQGTLLPLPSPTGEQNGSMNGSKPDADREAAKKAAQQHYVAARAQSAHSLLQAQAELRHMRSEPRMIPLQQDIDDLLDYVAIRLDPQADGIALAHRFLQHDSPRLRQSLIDFTVLHTSEDEGNAIPAIIAPVLLRTVDTAADLAALDLVTWVETLNGSLRSGPYESRSTKVPDAAELALHHWQSSHSTAWLAAALMLAKAPNADIPALLSAARAVPATDPAYLTVTYHRLRLSPVTPATRAEDLALLTEVRRTQQPSAVNQFTGLTAATAPTLADWLPFTGRVPAGISSDGDNPDSAPYSAPKENACGHVPASYTLFDTDAAVALNQDMPLRLLAIAAESPTLPENLRFQVAQATWARAVLLDKPAIAARMTPLLEACRIAWKPVLDTYDSAATATDRHASGLFALMRFASTEPSVREGDERGAGFATYSQMSENWWCSAVPRPGGSIGDTPLLPSEVAALNEPPGSGPDATPTPPPPAFLTAADLREANAEVATLRNFSIAANYFAAQALAWFQQYPNDPRTPELLGQANQVLRNACGKDQGTADKPVPGDTGIYAHALFDALHQHYPDSPWTKKFRSWRY